MDNNNNNTFGSLDNVITNQNPLLITSREDSTMLPWSFIRSDPLQIGGGFDIFNSLLANKYVSSSSTSRSINVQETTFEEAIAPPLHSLHPLDHLDSSNNMWSFGESSEFQAYSCGDNVVVGDPNEPIMSTTFDESDFTFLVSNERNDLSLSLVTDVSDESTRIASEQASCSSNKDITNNVSQVIFGSKYLHSVQEILSHFAAYSLNSLENNNPQRCYSTRGTESGAVTEYLDSGFNNSESILHRRSLEEKKNHLLDLLQMVDDQYTHCIDEIHTVVSAFHAATELDPQLHTRFALQTISSLYKNLRERISKKILMIGSVLERGKDKSQEASMFHQHCLFQQMKSKNHQIWRPQRGLPEKSVSVLRTWMFQNFLHPYPKDSEKHLLAIRSGLSRNQVSNWFINARVRLWKPMIEEMYAEMNKRKMNNTHIQSNGGSIRMSKSVMMCQEKGQRRE